MTKLVALPEQFQITDHFDPLDEEGSYRVVAVTTNGTVYLLHGPTLENGSFHVRRLEPPVTETKMRQIIDDAWDGDVLGEFDQRSVVADFKEFKPGQVRVGQPINLVSLQTSDVALTASFSSPVLSLAVCRE